MLNLELKQGLQQRDRLHFLRIFTVEAGNVTTTHTVMYPGFLLTGGQPHIRGYQLPKIFC